MLLKPKKYSQLHHHDHLRPVVVGGQALHQLGVVQEVHQLNLLASGLPLLGTPALVELSRALPRALLVQQLKHLPKFTTETEEDAR